ncbi:MAG: PQQ-binding-like beta-propeller repeat protein, partial [Planctomycetota bacterium]|nr:PQQ-binding-like beta-propeller repeat protein [Planctomycetota bacterium]
MVKFEIRSHAITIAMLACLTATASAQNWPSFRGPGATGIGTGDPPVKWNVEERKNVKWVTPIPGLAHSSPIIWGDRVYLTTAVSKKKDPELHTGWLQGTGRSPKEAHPWKWKILCLHKATGEILWRKTAHTDAAITDPAIGPAYTAHPVLALDGVGLALEMCPNCR